jgi:hypothetical protein
MPETMIGTLYCGENDFEKAKEAIASQTYKDYEHVIISNLQENEAHEKLYRSFKEGRYKYLIKIDADIVLNSSDALMKMTNAAKTKTAGMFPMRVTADVDDFFTGILLQGLHLYSNEVSWDWSKFKTNSLTPDRFDSLHKNRQRIRIKKMHEVLGSHCYHASEKQAFHFGYHRALKGHKDRCREVVARWEKTRHKLIWMVCIGIYTAINIKDYSGYCYNENFDAIFNKYSTTQNSEDVVIKSIKSFSY